MGLSPSDIAQRIRHRYELYRYVYPFVRHRKELPDSVLQDNIYLFTQPRSGSTWLSEIFLRLPQSQIINEPFNRWSPITLSGSPPPSQARMDELRELNTYYYQPVPEAAEWPELDEVVCRLLRLEVPKVALHWESDRASLRHTRHFVFKFCFANLMMPWMVRKFGIRPILLVRHPCAVVYSQMQLEHWQPIVKSPQIAIPDFRYSEIFREHEDFYKGFTHPEEVLAFIWALNTVQTIGHPRNNVDWCTVSYEHLYEDFRSEVQRMFKWLGMDVPEGVEEVRNRAASYTRKYSLKTLGSADHLSAWRERLTREQIARVFNVLEYFRFPLYTSDLYPDDSLLYSAGR